MNWDTLGQAFFGMMLVFIIGMGIAITLGSIYLAVRDGIYPDYIRKKNAQIDADLFDKKMQSIKKHLPNMENDAMAMALLDRITHKEQ